MDTRRADSIADDLEKMIFSGEFKDGARLDEQKLADHFGVSRTPLREALQKLATSNLIELVPRRGAFVRHPGPVELVEMFEVMAELEATCARLSARRISDAALQDLKTANAGCAQAAQAKDTESYYDANESFHFIIYAQSGNSFLKQETTRLHRRLQPFRRHQLNLRGRMQQSFDEHQSVIAALSNSDPEGAATALRNHVAVQGEKFHHLMTGLKSTAP